MSFSDRNLSSVRNHCRHRKLFTFLSSTPELPAQFQSNLAQIGIQVHSNEGPRTFKGDIIAT